MHNRINQNLQGRKVKISIGKLVGNLTANGEQNELHLSEGGLNSMMIKNGTQSDDRDGMKGGKPG
jgi:hypothetical protein